MRNDRHYHHHHHHHYDRDRDGYRYSAVGPGPGPNMHRLYKDKKNAMFAGVCAGFANYYGWNANAVRAALVFMTFFTGPLSAMAYIIAAFALKPGPAAPVYQSPEDERFWRTFSTHPKVTFSELKHRFRALDARLAKIEHAVVSDEYGLRKAFRDLERGA